jgi:hypothetical protein
MLSKQEAGCTRLLIFRVIQLLDLSKANKNDEKLKQIPS